MDRSKNKTDLLAAGRKKLQQFRQKKDHKGSGSSSSGHGKSSSKASKVEKDGDPSDPSKIVETNPPLVDADAVNTDTSEPSVMPSDDKKVSEGLPTVSLDQEVNSSGAEQRNGENSESRTDGANESVVTVVSDTERKKEDLDALPSLGAEVAREVDESSFALQVSHEGEGDELEMNRGWTNEEAGEHLISGCGQEQEANGSSISVEESQGEGRVIWDKHWESNSCEASSEFPSSSQDVLVAKGEDGAVVVDAEEGRNNEDTAAIGCRRTQEAMGLSIPLEVIPEAGANISENPKESTSFEGNIVILSSSQDIVATEGEVGAVAGEEGERQNNEEGMCRSETIEEASRSSIPGEVVQDMCMNLHDNPEKSSSLEEYLEPLASSSEDILATQREDSAVMADSERETRINEVGSGKSFQEFAEQGTISSGEKFEKISKEDYQIVISEDGLDSIKQHLYITNVAKDVLQFQLAEQIELNTEYYHDEVSRLWGLVKDAQESKAMMCQELEQCRSELRAMSTEKEYLNAQCLSMKEETGEFHSSARQLQSKMEQSQDELSRVLAELADCRGSLDALQKENLDLKASLTLERGARKQLMGKKELLTSENEKLASELLEQKERLHNALEKQVQLQGNLEETGACFEQLMEENLYLSCSSDIHKEKLKELVGRHCELPSHVQEAGNRLTFLQKDDEDDSQNSVVLEVLKQHLEEAKIILHNLEKSVEGMHSHSVSLMKSGGRASPGISKIIQAFESKAHSVENVADEVPLIEGGRSDDSYTLTKEQACNLRGTLNQLELDVGKAEMHLKKEQSRGRLSKKFEMDCETQRQQNTILQERVDEHFEKVSGYKSMILDLQNHIDGMQKSAGDVAGRLLSQVDILQKEVNDKASALQQEEDSIRGTIYEAIEKLDASTGLQIADNLDVGSHVMASVDAAVLAIKSLNERVEGVNLNYYTLQLSYEELNKLFMDMQGRKESANRLLKKFYSSLRELVYGSLSSEEAIMDVNAEGALQHLAEYYDPLIKHLQNLLDERQSLLATNNELESGLLSRNQEIEELNARCNTLSKKLEDECHSKGGLESVLLNKDKIFEELNNGCLALAKKLEDHKLSEDVVATPGFMKSSDMDSEKCHSSLFRLESLVTFHLQKFDEVMEQIRSSKNCLREVIMDIDVSADNWSLSLPMLLRQEFVPQVCELQEKLHLLSASNLQQETELRLLKEGLHKMEEALEVSRSELNSKVSELEQSEQRLSSVREKLSIAVAKGKGLIVQRDTLKQSLTEKSMEIEKCMQELQSKEALLHEVEGKLKSCSEVERVEALESELSYIRDSATAMRDSFLLKDSVLQRIEEVLEDLDLPENFHSNDIVEKIEMLSRLVSGNSSFAVTDWDQKSSEGRSHSDAGFVVMDSWKDDVHPSPSQELDALKRKYEELQSKFYGLAEHNDMLEQSLVERNSLVQKWEEVLDGIDLPPNLRPMEPEDKIECLGRALFDIQQDRDSLQLKIENLEISSDMLIADLEESHKKISELSAEVVAVKSEKEFFLESLNKLRFEYLALSEKAVHDELERENLQRELADFQDKLVQKVEDRNLHDLEDKIRELHDLVSSALPDSDKFEPLSGVSDAQSLEGVLRKLLHNYSILASDKSIHNEVHSEERNLLVGKQTSDDVLHDKEQEFVVLRSQLDETSHILVLVKEERDAATEKCHSLMLEMEEITRQMNLLREEKTNDMEKYRSLVLELEAMGKQKNSLQEQLTQEEQRSASAREKLNIAVRKGKALVQQRDSLKQTIEEMNIMLEHLKVEHNQRIEALEIEKSSLMSRLAETEQNLQESSQALSRLLTAVHAVDVGSEVNNPVRKIEEIGRLSHDLHLAVVSSENETKKSKQAAELLLAELNEVQERADILQEELATAEAALTECSKQNDDVESVKADALSRLEQFMSAHTEEREKQMDSIVELKVGIDQLRKVCIGFSTLLSDVFKKDIDLMFYVESFVGSIVKHTNGENEAYLPTLQSSDLSSNLENSHAIGDNMHSHFDDGSIAEHLAHACCSLHDCLREYGDLKENIHKHSFSMDQQVTCLSEILATVKRKVDSQEEYSESLKREIIDLEMMIKEKESEISSMNRNVSILYEACSCSIAEIENRKAQSVGHGLSLEEHVSGVSGVVVTLSGNAEGKEHADRHNFTYTDESVTMMANSLLSTVKGSRNIKEIAEGSERELKVTISDLQRELQEKDVEMNTISAELVSQIREAEAVAKRYVTDLDSARTQVMNLEKKIAIMENDRNLLESRVNELQDYEASSKQLQERHEILNDALAAKDQEIEALMQALDEEESQMEALENRNKKLEDIVQAKLQALENLEASQAKTMAKLSTTMNKFDELHDLSESLLTEIEDLQSQLQGRDSEISFLRQEVTRCTDGVLVSQETNKKYSSEIHKLLTWMDMMVTRFGEPHVHIDDESCSQIHVYTDILDKKIVSIMAELEELRETTQSKDAMLQIEKSRVEVLKRKTEDLKSTIHEKEPQIEAFLGERDTGQPSSINSPKSPEIEKMVQRNKISSGPIMTHVRSGRKVNNDQIAISVDMEKDNSVLEDEDDDKAHGFKSLTMSRLIPRATRPITDRIDGIWVSGERLLMRQPILRLGVMIYWIALHALLASII